MREKKHKVDFPFGGCRTHTPTLIYYYRTKNILLNVFEKLHGDLKIKLLINTYFAMLYIES